MACYGDSFTFFTSELQETIASAAPVRQCDIPRGRRSHQRPLPVLQYQVFISLSASPPCWHNSTQLVQQTRGCLSHSAEYQMQQLRNYVLREGASLIVLNTRCSNYAITSCWKKSERLCGLVEFLATYPEVPGSIPGITRFPE
jgi:hypothetical protein